MKFRKGLRRDLQDQIAQLAYGRPDDADPQAWYTAALVCAENVESNALFHGSARNSNSFASFRNMVPTPIASHQPPHATVPTPSRPHPQYAPMDIDATKRKAPTPDVCYRCGQPGHRKPQCPQRFDVRHMTTDECEGWMKERGIGKGVRKDVEDKQDFQNRKE